MKIFMFILDKFKSFFRKTGHVNYYHDFLCLFPIENTKEKAIIN
jgi:hypothetical protein